MKKTLGIAIALLLGLAVAGAWSAEIQVKIICSDELELSIFLVDGTLLLVAEGLPMDNLKEGASVKASYEMRDGKNVTTSLEVSD